MPSTSSLFALHAAAVLPSQADAAAEASLWLNGRQLYLGSFNSQARADAHPLKPLLTHSSLAAPLATCCGFPVFAAVLTNSVSRLHPVHLCSLQEDAAHAYDLAPLACKGLDAQINFAIFSLPASGAAVAPVPGLLKVSRCVLKLHWVYCQEAYYTEHASKLFLCSCCSCWYNGNGLPACPLA
jgi:hypothetical protein